MQGMEDEISRVCDGKVPCMPPNARLEVGSVLVLNPRKNPSKKDVSVKWFNFTNNRISEFKPEFEEELERQVLDGQKSSHVVASVSIRDLKGNMKCAVLDVLGLGATAGANSSGSGSIKVIDLQKVVATRKLKNLLGSRVSVADMIQQEQELKMVATSTNSGVLAVVESVYKASVVFKESSDSGASLSLSGKGKAAEQGGSGKVDAKAEVRDGKTHVLFADSSAIGFGVYFYKVSVIDGTLYMSDPQKLFGRSDHSIREAMSWARSGPVSKTRKLEQLRMLKHMKPCAHFVAALASTESADTYPSAKAKALQQANDSVGIENHMVRKVGVALLTTHSGDAEDTALKDSFDQASEKMDGYIDGRKSADSKEKDAEMIDEDDADTEMQSSVTLIRSGYGEETLAKLYLDWIGSGKNLDLEDGWFLKEVRICVFVDVAKSGLVPVTLETGQDTENAPGSVFRYLKNGDYLTTPVIGGPENIRGSQRRMFGNYVDGTDWRIEVSKKFLENDRVPEYSSLIQEGFVDVKREHGDIDYDHEKGFVKMMRYSLLNSSKVAQGGGECIGAAAETKQRSRSQASAVSPSRPDGGKENKKQKTEDA